MHPPAQILQFPLRAGIDEGTDPKQLPPGTLTALKNGVWNKSGRVEKRYGTASYSSALIGGGAVGTIKRLLSRGAELAAIDADRVYAYSPTVQLWRDLDQSPALSATWDPLLDAVKNATDVDIAVSGSYLCVAYTVGSPGPSDKPVYVYVRDLASGSLVVPPTLCEFVGATQGWHPRVLVNGTDFLVLYSTASGTIQQVTVDMSAFTVGLTAALVGGGAVASTKFDAVLVGTDIVIAYELAATGFQLERYDSALVLQASAVIAAEAGQAGFDAICLHGTTGETLYVAYSRAGTTRLYGADPSTLALVFAPAVMFAGTSRRVSVTRYDATNCLFSYTEQDGAPNHRYQFSSFVVSNAGVIDTTTTRTSFHLELHSKPFQLGSRWYQIATTLRRETATTNDRQPSHVVVELDVSSNSGLTNLSHRHVATLETRTAWPNWMNYLAQVAAYGSAFLAAVPYRTASVGPLANASQAYSLATLGVGLEKDTWRSVQAGRNAIVCAGATCTFDGRQCHELGFVNAPYVIGAAGGGGSGAMATGNYQYVCVYEWRDLNGVLHRSIPSAPITVLAVPVNGSVTLTVYCTSVDCKQTAATGYGTATATPVRIAIYRTTVGASTFYRLTHEPDYNSLLNDPTVRAVTFTDTVADADISGGGLNIALNSRPQLYTTGGVLEAVQPPSSVTACIHRSRLWLLDGSRRRLWYSQDLSIDPSIAPEFHENLTVDLEDVATGIASLDEKLVVFSKEGISIVVGDGPSPNGQGADLLLTGIQTDVGCIDPRSVVEMPHGVMFQSRRGLYILTRGLELKWIGKAVQDQLVTYPTVTSAVLVAHRSQVRFTCINAGETAGIVLVWDYENGVWSTFDLYDSFSQLPAIPSAIYHEGVWTWARSIYAFYDDEATHLDLGSWVTLSFTVAWIASAGPVAFQHIRRAQLLGERMTHHDLTLEYGFDHASTFAQAFTFIAEDRKSVV